MTAALRIAHLTPTWFSDESVVGGGERYVRNACRAIQVAAAENDIEVQCQVLATGPRLIETIDEGVRTSIMGASAVRSSHMDQFSLELWDVLNDVDIVHIHQSLTLFGAYATAVVASLGIPCVLTDHGGGHSPLMTSARGIELAASVVSVSKYARSLLAGEYSGPSFVIMGPVDTNLFRPTGETCDERPYIVSLGRLMPHKGFDRIIRALPSNLQLKVVGRSYDPEYLQELVRLSEGKNVEIITSASDSSVRLLLSNALGYVHASTHTDYLGRHVSKPELMGLAPLEALACGTPILLADTASLPELAEGTPYARVFRSDAELADLLLNLAERGWPVPVDAHAAWDFVRSRYGLMPVGSQLLDVYRRAIEGFVR